MTTERPILFSAPMVRAILAGTKTQTRRAMTNQPQWDSTLTPPGWCWHGKKAGEPSLIKWPNETRLARELTARAVCPYGQAGDRLWVRETWGLFKKTPDDHVHACVRGDRRADGFEPHYRATDTWDMPAGAWRPSIHMPRWASRLTLEITGVRAERLQTISAADAKAEGIEGQFDDGPWRNYGRDGYWFPEGKDTAPVLSYRSLWEKINGPDSWAADPWVWVVEFKRVQP